MTDEKYTDSTYMTVSELPIMTDAISDAPLSGPHRDNSSENDAIDAEPDMGRVSRSGVISDGSPTAPSTPEREDAMSSASPDANSMDVATISAHSDGKSFAVVRMPLAAPSRNASNAP